MVVSAAAADAGVGTPTDFSLWHLDLVLRSRFQGQPLDRRGSRLLGVGVSLADRAVPLLDHVHNRDASELARLYRGVGRRESSTMAKWEAGGRNS